jgi:Chitobiase/beta-hexosaminidase C-terminal domain
MRRYQLIPSHAVQTLLITTTSPIPSGEVGFPYSFTFNAIGGTPPYSWLAGTLPAGLSISGSGTISGTPTTPVSSLNFNVLVIDAVNSQFNRVFSQTIISAVSITTTSPLPNATQGVAYGTTIAATGGATPYAWSLTQTGSNGWAINSATGVVTGTPSVLETDVLTVTVVDALGVPSAKNFNLQVTTAGVVATPTFSPIAGTYTSTQTVTISCVTPSSSIYKTTDGSTPTFPITGTTTLYTGPLTVSASETIKAIGVASGLTNSSVASAAYVISIAGSTIPNITSLSATFPGPNTTAYNALNVPAMAHATFFNDPVTNIVTCKITDTTTPASGGNFAPWYSQMGLGISQAWGPNLDQYHVAFINASVTAAYVCDYGPSWSSNPVGSFNFTNLPAALSSYTNGMAAFSRRAGNPDIMYVLTSGGHLRLYNVVTQAFVDSSAAALGYSASWPATGWPWNAGIQQWLMINATETWAHARTGTQFVALNLTTGATQSWTPAGIDDAYVGYGDFATGDGQEQTWNLDANTQISYVPTLTSGNGWPGGQATSHVAVMRGFWIAFNTQGTGSLPMPAATIAQGSPSSTVIGSTSVLPFSPKCFPQWHTSGNYWLQPSGTGQYFLMSNIGTASASYPATEWYANSFINVWAGTLFRLGHNYSTVPNPGTYYYEQPHAHVSHDGKLVMFGSNMLQTPTSPAPAAGSKHIDLFIQETPLIAGSPPSFP